MYQTKAVNGCKQKTQSKLANNNQIIHSYISVCVIVMCNANYTKWLHLV